MCGSFRSLALHPGAQVLGAQGNRPAAPLPNHLPAPKMAPDTPVPNLGPAPGPGLGEQKLICLEIKVHIFSIMRKINTFQLFLDNWYVDDRPSHKADLVRLRVWTHVAFFLKCHIHNPVGSDHSLKCLALAEVENS